MLNNIILFITATLGVLCTLLILRKNRNQEHYLINKYLIILIIFATSRFFLSGLAVTFPQFNISNVLNLTDVGLFIVVPCFYLYFQNIINENKFNQIDLLHFALPLLVGIAFIINNFGGSRHVNQFNKVLFFVSILVLISYAVFGFVMLYKHIWNRKTDIKAVQKQNNLMTYWTLFLYVCFIALLFIRVAAILSNNLLSSDHYKYIWVPALVWTGIFINIIIRPEILYGYNFLAKTINTANTTTPEKIIFSDIWLTERALLPITIEREGVLEKKIAPLLLQYIHQIEVFSFQTPAFRNPDLNPYEISVALNIPLSHINFVFKYHCNESFTDYKKIVRINDAIKLIEEGYLKHQKIETLSAAVGFTSYNTFNTAFKSITGITALEYMKRLKS
jgi:AraC-like DNA-binding protein